MTTDNQAMLQLLKENLRLLGKSRKTLMLSVDKARRIGEKSEYYCFSQAERLVQ
jgi:hypothetical protein